MPDVLNMVPGFPGNLTIQVITIKSGASATDIIPTQGQALVGIFTPAAWTAALIGYQACWDGNVNDSVSIYDGAGNPQTTTVTVSAYIAFPMINAVFGPWIRLTSVLTGDGITPVAQGADRVFYLIFRRLFS